MIKSIAISIGGSIIFDENGNINIKNLKKIENFINKLLESKAIIGLCVGGGIYARKYIEEVKKIGLSKYDQHYIGMLITQINAYILAKFLKVNKVYYSFFEVSKDVGKNNLFIIGGLVPGFTTDVDTAILAKSIKADILINITNVNGIYDKDPKKYKDAKLLKKISYEDFLKLAKNFESEPGVNFVFDPRAIEIIKEDKIKIFVVSIEDLNKLYEYITGQRREYPGSLIE